jgi:hypothetical protein
MKNLNHLVLVVVILSCIHAVRSYLHAAAPAGQSLKVSNGTDWHITVRYTTPAGVATSDTVAPQANPLMITIKPEADTSYSLSKEQGKIKTDTRKIPAAALQQGVFELTPDTIKEMIAAFLPAPVPVVQTAAAGAPTPTIKK